MPPAVKYTIKSGKRAARTTGAQIRTSARIHLAVKEEKKNFTPRRHEREILHETPLSLSPLNNSVDPEKGEPLTFMKNIQ